MRTWIAVLTLAAACSHSSKTTTVTPATTPLATGATCDQMGAHLVQIMPASGDAEMGKKVSATLQQACTTDAWSAQARQCLFDVKDLREADTCKQYLTKAQIDSADKQMDAAMPAPPPGSVPPAETDVAPPTNSTRAPQKKKTGDPCEGGQVTK